MCSHDAKVWIHGQNMVSRGENRVFLRSIGLFQHIPLGIHLVVLERRAWGSQAPSFIWFGGMDDECLAMVGDILIDGLESRIVKHDVLARPVYDFHTDVLPDFCRDRAASKV